MNPILSLAINFILIGSAEILIGFVGYNLAKPDSVARDVLARLFWVGSSFVLIGGTMALTIKLLG